MQYIILIGDETLLESIKAVQHYGRVNEDTAGLQTAR